MKHEKCFAAPVAKLGNICCGCNICILEANVFYMAKLGNIVAETLLRVQMFSSLATQETLLRMQILRP